VGVARLVQASTIGVYTGVTTEIYREDAPLPTASAHPILAYRKVRRSSPTPSPMDRDDLGTGGAGTLAVLRGSQLTRAAVHGSDSDAANR